MIKFLEPLENPPGNNQKATKIIKTSPKKSSPKKSSPTGSPTKENKAPNGNTSPPKDDISPENKMPEKSAVVENGPDVTQHASVNHTGVLSPPEGSVSTTTTKEEGQTVIPAGEVLNSNNKNTTLQDNNTSVHLQIPDQGASGTKHSVQEQLSTGGVTSPTSKRGSGSVANSRSFSSDSSLGDTPTGQVMTTVAQVHREDSTLMGGATSPGGASSDRSIGNDSVASTNGNNTSASDTTVEEASTPVNITPCARLTETILENESTGSDLSQLSETSDHVVEEPRGEGDGSNGSTPVSFPVDSQEWQTRTAESGGGVSGREIQVNRTDSGYTSASSVNKSNMNHVQSQSTQTQYEESLAEKTTDPQTVPYADENESVDGIDGNSLSSQPDVLEGVEGATQSPRPSIASSTDSDESVMLDMDSLENALMSNSKNLDVPSAKRLAKRLYTLDGFKKSDVAKHLSKR